MAEMTVDSDGNIVIRNVNTKEQREIVKKAGGKWGGLKLEGWILPFTLDDYSIFEKVEYIFDCFGGLEVAEAVTNRLVEAEAKHREMKRLREKCLSGERVMLKVSGLKGKLHNYQKLGVMYSCANEMGTLLADEMGLGKTLQAIATSMILKNRGECDSALVITPASLKWNWPIEIEKWTDETWTVIDGTPKKREEQWLSDSFFTIANYELVTEDLFGGRNYAVSPTDTEEQKARKKATMARAEARAKRLRPIRNRKWGMIILDEAHAIAGHTSQRSMNIKELNTKHRMALTGTPMDGKLEHLHSVMQFVCPGLFPTLARFMRDHADFDSWGGVARYKNLGRVKKKIAPFYIRRLKKNVLKELPKKVYSNRYVELTKKEEKAYKDFATTAKRSIFGGGDRGEQLKSIIRCKQFCDLPELADPDTDIESGSKIKAFAEIMEEIVVMNGHKAIVFSQYKKMLPYLKDVLSDLGLKHLEISGDTDKKVRADLQKEFNENPKIDVILGTDAMSQGLNLTGADYVVNYDDPWSNNVLRQRGDRAHRIGQLSTVTVVNFIVKGTVEERVRKVLVKKSKLSAEVLSDDVDEGVLNRLSPEEIVDLL